MNYLAFDIEAANGYKQYSICSIGYVLADENFNVLKKENIWINPKCKYNLNGTRERVGIDLHLDPALLEASPDFSQVYDRVKTLLTDKNVRVVGHAVESDVIMLNKTCLHYKLPCINFEFICSQLLFRLFKKEKDVRALNKIAEEIGFCFKPHSSDEDALASLMTLKYLVNVTGKSVDELLKDYNVRVGVNRNFDMTRTVSLTGQLSKNKITKQAVAKIFDFITKNRLKPKTNLFKNQLFCLSRGIEAGDEELCQKIISCIYVNGGQYTAKACKCDWYLTGESDLSQNDKQRLNYIKSLNKGSKPIKVLSAADFLLKYDCEKESFKE